MPVPHCNPAKGIPWLVKEWANIEQYLQIGEIKEAIVDETAMSMTTQEIQEIQELADLQRELEETSEEESDVIITQDKKSSTKGKKGTLKKGVQFENLPKNKKAIQKPNKGKGKEADKDQSTSSGDDPEDDSSSSSESSDEKGGDSEEESEDNTRKVRQLSPSQKEWKQVTGKKIPAKGTSKIGKNTSLVKLLTPEMFDRTNKKWRNPTTFDQYIARMAEWLTY